MAAKQLRELSRDEVAKVCLGVFGTYFVGACVLIVSLGMCSITKMGTWYVQPLLILAVRTRKSMLLCVVDDH